MTNPKKKWHSSHPFQSTKQHSLNISPIRQMNQTINSGNAFPHMKPYHSQTFSHPSPSVYNANRSTVRSFAQKKAVERGGSSTLTHIPFLQEYSKTHHQLQSVLSVHVQPGASHSRFDKINPSTLPEIQSLKVWIKERPVENQTNKALVAFLEDAVKIKPITLLRGAKSRDKTLLIPESPALIWQSLQHHVIEANMDDKDKKE